MSKFTSHKYLLSFYVTLSIFAFEYETHDFALL